MTGLAASPAPDEDSIAPRRSQASGRPQPVRPSSIVLIDHTKPADDDRVSQTTTSDDLGEGSAARITSVLGSLRDHKNKWKYARYSEDRAEGRQRSRSRSRPGSPQSVGRTPDAEREESAWGRSTFEQRRQHLKDKFRSKRVKKIQDDNGANYDILYENQRGVFLCGVPFFSAKALNQFEPSAWVDGNFKKSRVNITNAQLPDPSWEWAWRTWYVDMGHDVDEEGWEYSFFFRGFRWHGTHPWFHSFVRRRRWLRKRIRKRRKLGDKTLADAHMMNPDYFTIHSPNLKPLLSGAVSPVSEGQSSAKHREWEEEEGATWENREIRDIGTLFRALKDAPVDSERISLIKRFLDQGGDDLNYLADEIPTILSFFFYENSVRTLLAIINSKLDSATSRNRLQRNGEPENHDQSRSIGKRRQDDDNDHGLQFRYIESLQEAADAVAQQCKKLEFWSDIREATGKGHDTSSASGIHESGDKLHGLGVSSGSVDLGATSAAEGPQHHNMEVVFVPDNIDDIADSTYNSHYHRNAENIIEDVASRGSRVDGAREPGHAVRQENDQANRNTDSNVAVEVSPVPMIESEIRSEEEDEQDDGEEPAVAVK